MDNRVRGMRPIPPGQPSSGYGSSAGYICHGYNRLVRGRTGKGTRVASFLPSELKSGDRAPLVLFFSGFMTAWPAAYLDFIEHLCFGGNIVVFPSYNLSSPLGAFRDSDQEAMTRRLVRNVEDGIAMVGSRADLSDVTVFGHSLGGLFANCYLACGGIEHKAIVSANPVTSSKAGMPAAVRRLVSVNEIDWRSLCRDVEVPVTILAGDHDDITGVGQAWELCEALAGSRNRSLYCLQGDDHGRPPVRADHLACLGNSSVLPSFLAGSSLGSFVGAGPADYRYYWAALDAAIDNQVDVTFDMGEWSDGRPVKPVLKLE